MRYEVRSTKNEVRGTKYKGIITLLVTIENNNLFYTIYPVNMKKVFTLLLILLSPQGIAQIVQKSYEVKVHPGMELMHIINYLAGVNQPLVKNSTYLDAVDDWFGNYKDHPAV